MLTLAALTIFASCSTGPSDKETALQASQRTIDSLKLEMVRQQVIDSMNELNRMQFSIPQVITVAEAPKAVKKTVTKKKATARKSTSSNNSGAGSVSSGSSSGGGIAQAPAPVYEAPAPVYETPAPAPVEEKKGWSAKAKGAVIGAGAGAAAGAIINKRNRGVGAAIGGVLGAGAGTGIGAIIDKKNGR